MVFHALPPAPHCCSPFPQFRCCPLPRSTTVRVPFMCAKIVHYVQTVNGHLVAMQKTRCQLPPSKPSTTKNDSHAHAVKHTQIAVVPSVCVHPSIQCLIWTIMAVMLSHPRPSLALGCGDRQWSNKSVEIGGLLCCTCREYQSVRCRATRVGYLTKFPSSPCPL